MHAYSMNDISQPDKLAVLRLPVDDQVDARHALH
jgi:hypothetical protein